VPEIAEVTSHSKIIGLFLLTLMYQVMVRIGVQIQNKLIHEL